MPRPPSLRIGQVIRQRRRELGLSQEDVAARARLSHRTIQELERHPSANPQLETLDRLAEALRMTLSELVDLLETGDQIEDEDEA